MYLVVLLACWTLGIVGTAAYAWRVNKDRKAARNR